MDTDYTKLYDTDYTFELPLAIETNFRFDGVPKQLITFENGQFIWINGDHKWMPLIVVPLPDKYTGLQQIEDARGYDEVTVEEKAYINRFLTKLACQYMVPFKISPFGRWIVLKGEGENMRMPRTPPEFIGNLDEINDTFPSSETLRLAMAVFREGLNANNALYAFINFYKIIELGAGKPVNQIKWINNNFDQAIQDWPWAKSLPVRQKHSNEGNYLYGQCRNIIDHSLLKRGKNTRNPDDPRNDIGIYHDIEILKALAVRMIITKPW